MHLDSAVAKVLKIDANRASVSSVGGGCSSASASKITVDGGRSFFLKCGSGPDAELMFQGEAASLAAIHAAVPSLCPHAHGWGRYSSSSTYFLVTDFVELGSRRSSSSTRDGKNSMSLAAKLAKLHTTPAPLPDGFSKPVFGFPVTTCCGDTPQDNSFAESWADFYANRRLRFIGDRCTKSNGSDAELKKLIEDTSNKVVPRLLGDGHLGGKAGITPVVVHGDLWSGNAGYGTIGGKEASTPGDIVYDPSAFYAHSEYELGIMKMFGGFSGILAEYHKLCPKTEPISEYDDRIALYELYHQLNHHALFGGGYRNGAVNIMRSLLNKYGNGPERI